MNLFEVTFLPTALPGVAAVGSIRRGQSAQVSAAEAVRLVDVKGLAFANPDDEATARQAVAAESVTPITTETAADDPAVTTEEH